MPNARVTVVGGGLAGSEAAWQLVRRDIPVTLVEMRPLSTTEAHQTDLLGELVCSNSLKSLDPRTPGGILKAELAQLDSLILGAAQETRVPAGSALAVDREAFARRITERLSNHPLVDLQRRRQDDLPDPPAILATGPLTSGALARAIEDKAGKPLTFYDAIAPILDAESIDFDKAFRASRWDGIANQRPAGPGPEAYGFMPEDSTEGDYVNCPMSRDEYEAFVEALLEARQVVPHEFEEPRYFESCLPIEVMAARGMDVLRHGPMRPVGLRDPRDGRRPHAVVQLRPENRHGTAYNMVGFQTRLTYPEQDRVFRTIPGLERARFFRHGSIHRNTYLHAPECLDEGLLLKEANGLRVAGLLAGVEGYMESVAMGLLAALFTAADIQGIAMKAPPDTTALGSLYAYLRQPPRASFTPTNMNMSLLPPVEAPKGTSKKERRLMAARRAVDDLLSWKKEHQNLFPD